MEDKVDNKYYGKGNNFMGSNSDQADNQDNNINNDLHAW